MLRYVSSTPELDVIANTEQLRCALGIAEHGRRLYVQLGALTGHTRWKHTCTTAMMRYGLVATAFLNIKIIETFSISTQYEQSASRICLDGWTICRLMSLGC